MSMKLATAMYDRSPIWLQNLLLSGYGLKLRSARYGGIYRQYLEFLRRAESYSEAQVREFQARELRELLAYAARHVPWYRKMFAQYGVTISQVDPDNLWKVLPILSKSELRADGEAFCAGHLAGNKLHSIHTSGTTGTPLHIKATGEALQKNYAFFERFLNGAGVGSLDRSATFGGRMLLPPSQKGLPYWRHNRAMNTLLCSSYHISDQTIDDYLRAIARFSPAFIDAYPSAIYTVAQYVMAGWNEHPIRPRAIVTSSETLFDYQRSLIEKAFDCPVFDQYGSVEMASCVTQCEAGSYHINPEYGIVEVLGEDGRPVPPGESGELICTGFLNRAMPLIRYRIGDSAIPSDRSCTCGRAWPVLESLLGRVDDMLIGTDGRRVSRLSPLFKKVPNVKEAQVVQVARDQLVVNLVPEAGYTAAIGAALVDELRLRVGCDMEIELRLLEQIPRTSSGKFRAVVSELAAAAQGTGAVGSLLDGASHS